MSFFHFFLIDTYWANHKYDLVVDVVNHSHELLIHENNFQLLEVREQIHVEVFGMLKWTTASFWICKYSHSQFKHLRLLRVYDIKPKDFLLHQRLISRILNLRIECFGVVG